DIIKQILTKIKDGNTESLKNTLGLKMIKDNNLFFEDIEREKIQEDIYDELEIQEEKKVIPPGYSSVKEITKWAERKGILKMCQCGHVKAIHINLDKTKNK
ncbi:MAG: hypothetical protein WCF94_00790, partial [bacterium]